MNEIITIKERKSAKFSLVDCPLNIKYPFHIYMVEMTKILVRFSSFVMSIWVNLKKKRFANWDNCVLELVEPKN